MTPEDRRAAIRAELVRGDEARRAAEVLTREELLRDAMSRAYYATLHYARALLLVKDEEPTTHEGVLRRFSFHSVKTGLLTLDEGKILGLLHKLREDADYGIEQGYVVGEVQEELDSVRRFKDAVDPVLLSLSSFPFAPG